MSDPTPLVASLSENPDAHWIEEVSDMPADLAAEFLVLKLADDLKRALDIINWQNVTIQAAKSFCELISMTAATTGKPVFSLADNDQLAGETLNHRYVDLVALITSVERPIAPRLAQGTVH